MADEQADVIAFLSEPTNLGVPGESVRIVETHISFVFLAGARAFKLKRSVRLPYVDLSTREKRAAMCAREVLLNRRTAPQLYRGVRRVTRDKDGCISFDGAGQLIDTVVEMVRFDEDSIFDRLALRGALSPRLLTELARVIARFHDGAEIDRRRIGRENIAEVLTINESALATTDVFPAGAVADFNRAFHNGLDRYAARLDARQAAGKVRHCHGDLHLRNICLLDGAPTLFDCLEFDDAMATIDVLYDLAFLLMDLWHRGLAPEANFVFNRYFDERDESEGLPLLAFFMALRAAVRAHVTATAVAEQHDETRKIALRQDAQAYFDLAVALLELRRPHLFAVGGLSGSGKSTLAAAIAPQVGPPPGARVLSTDRIRKRLIGVPAETRLSEEAYQPEMSERVYRTQREETRAALTLGHGVVTDGVFDRSADRARIADIGSEVGVPFTGIWLDATPEVQIERLAKRTGDPSDAGPTVLREQLARIQAPVDWPHVEATPDLAVTCHTVLRMIKAR